MDFDEDRIYYSHQNLAANSASGANANGGEADQPPPEAMLDLEDGAVDLGAVRRHFREFLREFQLWLRFWCGCSGGEGARNQHNNGASCAGFDFLAKI